MIRPFFMPRPMLAGVLASGLLVTGCASLTVSQVTTTNESSVKGVRYFLPKPYLQVTPKSDGTVSVTVTYLPDTDHEYAVATSSYGSSYEFQITRDPSGPFLSAIEYKADTTAVGQQLAASAQAAAVQSYNLNAANNIADQTAVTSAQTAVDTATAALAASQAALASDTTNLPAGQAATITQLATDNSNVQQNTAKLAAAKDVLTRTQAQHLLAATNTISAASPLGAPAALAVGNQTAPTVTSTAYNLPNKFAPALFAINDSGTGSAEAVSLIAVTANLPDATAAGPTEINAGVVPSAQYTFATVSTGLGPPALAPATLTVKLSAKTAEFVFARPIDVLTSDGVSGHSEATPPVSVAFTQAQTKLKDDKVTLDLDISALTAGQTYDLTVPFKWSPDSSNAHDITSSAQVKVTVTP